jgi:hypothetical protein
VDSPDKSKALSKYFDLKLAVIEVKDGENQEEAWHRFLTLNPGFANSHIKIFHYPAKNLLEQRKAELKLLPAKPQGGKI